MKTITGKIKKAIYHNDDSNYYVCLFRVKEAENKEYTNKTINMTGTFYDFKLDALVSLNGEFVFNEKYSKEQFNVIEYTYIEPSNTETIIAFLASSFIDGCGKPTAKRIVDYFKEETLDKIRESKDNLLLVPKMTEKRADKIYNSLINYGKNDTLIMNLQKMGFSIEEAGKILNKYKTKTEEVIENDFYALIEIIDFAKLDNIYLRNHQENDEIRQKACILETVKQIAYITGNTYTENSEINKGLSTFFNITLEESKYLKYLKALINEGLLYTEESRIYLRDLYLAEVDIVNHLKTINEGKLHQVKSFDTEIKKIETSLEINYDDNQIKAIKNALESNISIISGGPGTGKTTIIKAIVKLYIEINHLSPIEVFENIALLAPTGRASKKLSTATNLPAYTIHRYLKWYKESDEFLYNENNKTIQKFIIVDEASMIDISLFSSLLKGIRNDVKLLLVGDAFQLPSVGPGAVLNDLIKSDYFTYIPLNKIYRQSDNSFIPYLAKEIKNHELEEDFLTKKDDYNFIKADSHGICNSLIEIIKLAKSKEIDETDLQVLAPIYKGENGIDNLNLILQNLFNPLKKNQIEIKYGDVSYRVGDKVLQLVNDPDNNVYNGDIGFIENINIFHKETIIINFDGNSVTYTRHNLANIKHAYAISVHKSQGSEFDHVIMPIAKEYYHMLYNKLIYTGISRAKKSLVLVGDPIIFSRGVNYDYAGDRKTTLENRIKNSL